MKDKSYRELGNYFLALRGKERVKVVCIDLSSSYRQLVKQYFPKTKIVADRFHVIGLLHHQCMQTYQKLDNQLKNHRGLLAALRTNSDNLTSRREQRRGAYLKSHPAINVFYQFKRRVHRLLMKKTLTAKRCRRMIPIYLKMVEQLKGGGFKKLRTLGTTFYEWLEEIVRMWRFTKSNCIAGGL